MKADILALGDDFAYVMVESHTVGSVRRFADGFKFAMESYIENVFSPSEVVEIRRVGKEAAVIRNVTKRLEG